MKRVILSTGIDIGTTTTQVVFSEIILEESSGFGMIPKMEVTEKQVVYRSRIYETPLLDWDEIDSSGVKEILQKEFRMFGRTQEDIESGAVIITGESAGKKNAEEVIHAIADIAGDFVAAAAGPDLEGVLAGKGSGSCALSEARGISVANLDIGGGTTNICLFDKGKVIETHCLDIGGRLVRIKNNEIIYMADSIQEIVTEYSLDLAVGDFLTDQKRKLLQKLVEIMVDILEKNLLTLSVQPEVISFSGGVAACIDKNFDDPYAFGDIGVLLGRALSQSTAFFRDHKSLIAKETVNATVIGAGNFSMEVSGSTIEHQNCRFPMKNIPVVHLGMDKESLDEFSHTLVEGLSRYHTRKAQPLAITFKGYAYPGYEEVEALAKVLAEGVKAYIKMELPLIIILQEDMAKALGQSLKRRLPKNSSLLCIDGICCQTGDFVDIGKPLAQGRVIPVVVKTLVFD